MNKKIIVVKVIYGNSEPYTPLNNKSVKFIFKKQFSNEVLVRTERTNASGDTSITIEEGDLIGTFDYWIAYATHNSIEKNTGYSDFNTLQKTLSFSSNDNGNIGVKNLLIYEDGSIAQRTGDLWVKFYKEGELLGTYNGVVSGDGTNNPMCLIGPSEFPLLSSAGTFIFYVYYNGYEAQQNGIEYTFEGQSTELYQKPFSYKKSTGFDFNITFIFSDVFQGNPISATSLNLYGTGHDSQYSYTFNPPKLNYSISGTSTSTTIRVSATTSSYNYSFSNQTPVIDLTANPTQLVDVLFIRSGNYVIYIPRIYDTFTELEDPFDFNLKFTVISLYNSSNVLLHSGYTFYYTDFSTIFLNSSLIDLSAVYKIEAKKYHYETVKMDCRIGRPFNYYAYSGNSLHILKNTGCYTGETGLVSYKKLKSITLQREEDACMTAKELNDYKHSFSGVDHSVLHDLAYAGSSGYGEGIRKVVPSTKETYFQTIETNYLEQFKKAYIGPLHTISNDVSTLYTLPPELEYAEDIRPEASGTGIVISGYTKYGDDSRHCYVMDRCIIPEVSGDTDGYLTFYTSNNQSDITLRKIGSPDAIDLQFNYDSDGWMSYTVETTIHLYENESVKFRRKPNSFIPPKFSKSENDYYMFEITDGKAYVKGNLKYLLDANASVTSTVSGYCFYKLFFKSENLRIKNYDDLKITFTSVHTYSFSKMFDGCSNIKYGSNMSSITSADQHAFEQMYKDCVRLERVGGLNGLQTIENATCQEMFFNCKNLKNCAAFSLNDNASLIGISGCCSMYEDCESLESTPILSNIKNFPYDYCCAKMFKGCKNISIMQPIQSSNVGVASFYAMFSACTSLFSSPLILNEEVAQDNVFPRVVEVSGCSHMYIGCSNLKSGGYRLELTALSACCYQYMFYGCVKLPQSIVPQLPATIIPDYGYYYMFYDCKSITDLKGIITESATKAGKYACCYMFAGCESLNFRVGVRTYDTQHHPIHTHLYVCLSPTDIGEGAYNHMFYKCNSLTSPSNIIICATTLNHLSCASMFEECEKIVSVVNLSNITKIGYMSCYAMYKNSGQFLPHYKRGGRNFTDNDFAKKALVIQKSYDLIFEGESNNSYSVCTYSEKMNTGAYSSSTLSLLTNKASFSTTRGEVSSINNLPTTGNINGDIYLVNGQKYIWYEDGFFRLLDSVNTLPEFPTSPQYQNYDVIKQLSDYKSYMLVSGKWVEIDLSIEDFIGETFVNMFYGSNVVIASMRINTRDLFGKKSFEHMFSNCKCLESGPELCDASYFDSHPEIWRNIGECAFDHCFSDCTYLTNNLYVNRHTNMAKPYLIVGTYDKFSCRKMYANCYNLKHYTSVHPVDSNDADGLSHGCFQGMFANCYSLPEFEKLALSGCTRMKKDCYQQMFFKCESLHVAPKLPAITLYDGCYSYMFSKANSYGGKVTATYSYTARRVIQKYYNPIQNYYFPSQTSYTYTSTTTFTENYYSDGFSYSHGTDGQTEDDALAKIDGYARQRILNYVSTLTAVTLTLYRVKYTYGDSWHIIEDENWCNHGGHTYVFSETGDNHVWKTGTTQNPFVYNEVINLTQTQTASTVINVYDTGVREITANFSGYSSLAALSAYTDHWVDCLKATPENHKFYKNPNQSETNIRGIHGIPTNWPLGSYSSSPNG